MTDFSDTHSLSFIEAHQSAQGREPDGLSQVGECLRADAEREVAILHAGREIQECMARYSESGCFADKGAADAARVRMEALIRGRSGAQVVRMELERGL